MVRDYASDTFLSMGREGSKIQPISDIGDIKKDPDVPADAETSITDAAIIGVLQLDSYHSCLRCKARVEPSTPPLAK